MGQRPLVTAAVIWVAGSAAAAAVQPAWLGWRTAGAALLLWALAGLLRLPGRRWLSPLLLLLVAASYYQAHDARNVSGLPASAAGTELLVEGVIASTVEIDGDRVAFAVAATSAYAPDGGGAAPNLLQRRERLQVTLRLLEQPEQAEAARWGRGDRIALTGSLQAPEPARNFGGFDYRRYLYRSHIHWLLKSKGAGSVTAEPQPFFAAPGLGLRRAMDDARDFLGGRFDRLFDPLQAGYMKSLVLGITDDFDPERFRQFSKLGLTHVLAISGLHVAVFVGGCLGLLRLLGFTREKMLTVTLILVPGYVLLTGGSPSVVRAGIMAMLALYASRRGLLKDGLHLLSAAALFMLLWEPYALFDVSFQLSFLVTAGLILGVPRFTELVPIRPPALSSAIAVTTVAQLVSFPVSIYYFNSFSLLSWMANLLLVPFISFVTLPVGSIALLISLVSVRVAAWTAAMADVCNRLTFWLVEIGARPEGLLTIWRTPPLIWIGLYAAGLAALAAAWRQRRAGGRLVPAAAASAAMLLLLGYAFWGFPPFASRSGTVSFLDVGQGDAILIRTPSGRAALIDGGGTVTFRKAGEEWKERREPYEVGAKLLVPLLKQRGIQSLDYVALTHQDADHMGGLQTVLEQLPVKRLVFNDTWKGNDGARRLFETASARGVELWAADAGDRIRLDAHAEWELLAPPDDGGEGPEVADEQNEASLVILLQMYGTRFLLTGDMGSAQEEEVLQRLQSGEQASIAGLPQHRTIDVLKVAHHGSKSSTSADWLTYWRPKEAVISVGGSNIYGHPNALVLDRLAQAGVVVFRTDLNGEIVYEVNRKGAVRSTKLSTLSPNSALSGLSPLSPHSKLSNPSTAASLQE